MKRRTVLLILLVVSAVIAGAFLIPPISVSGRIAERIRGEGGHVLDLRDVAGTDWDRVYFFGPYTPQQEIERQLGFPWPGLGGSAIESSDSVTLIVFVKNGKVVRSFDHPVDKGDFSAVATPGGLTKEQARFRIVRPASNTPTLERVTADGERD